MSDTDRVRWNKKYKSISIPTDPLDIVVENIHLANGNKALDIACGMGRNSRYLASHGFEVDAIDISSVAISNLQDIPNIYPKEVDLDSYKLPKDSYDLIVCTYYLNRSLFPQMIEALRDGGLLIFETFISHPDSKKAPSNPLFLLKQGELIEYFDTKLKIIKSDEYWSEDHMGNRAMKGYIVATTLSH
ncbi:Tellurite resistance protein-related protein [hydrothermal vent metagenome]|uniref:Tellurite resistance protein-related protein n=1 Tax=hydrothermal vent metagenome TaxID=652676 RepID=A0A1W1BEF0_9ZZZZ